MTIDENDYHCDEPGAGTRATGVAVGSTNVGTQ